MSYSLVLALVWLGAADTGVRGLGKWRADRGGGVAGGVFDFAVAGDLFVPVGAAPVSR